MRNEPKLGIFHCVFSSRISVVAAIDDALTPSPLAVDRFKEASSAFEDAISDFGEGDVEDQYRAFGLASGIFALLAEWKRAIRNAEPDAQRFLSAAKLKASEVDRTSNLARFNQLISILERTAEIGNPADLNDIQLLLKQWPLPLLMFANVSKARRFRLPSHPDGPAAPEKPETTVAFLKFDIDGQPAKHWNYLKPGTAYDLTIEVRVS